MRVPGASAALLDSSTSKSGAANFGAPLVPTLRHQQTAPLSLPLLRVDNPYLGFQRIVPLFLLERALGRVLVLKAFKPLSAARTGVQPVAA